MKTFEEFDEATGAKKYKVRVGGEVLSFASSEDREKYLYFLYMALVNKNKQLIDALVWLWKQRQAEILRVLKKYFSIFAAFILPLAGLQVVTSGNNFMIQNLLNQFVDFVLAAAPHHRQQEKEVTAPAAKYLSDFKVPDQHEPFAEKWERTRASRAEKEQQKKPTPGPKNGM